jgi:hypothetical protein
VDKKEAQVAASPGDLPETAHLESKSVRLFLSTVDEEYQKCLDSRDAEGVPSHVPRLSGLLFGRADDTEISIDTIIYVPNVRGSDEKASAEFEEIAIQFGDEYKNPQRGFWCDDNNVFQAIKQQSSMGLELLGSIHFHPNWHEIGPPQERRQRISENPTRTDEYLFRRASWPVNVICYSRQSEGVLIHRVAGWRPGSAKCRKLDIRIPREICGEFNVELPPSQ